MLLILRPTRTALTIPDDLAKSYGDILEYGALAHIHAVPGLPISSMSTAQYYRELFNDLTDAAQSHAANVGMRGVARTVKYSGAGT